MTPAGIVAYEPTQELGALAVRAMLGAGVGGGRIRPLGGSLVVRMSTASAVRHLRHQPGMREERRERA